jgi:hypothetical protein
MSLYRDLEDGSTAKTTLQQTKNGVPQATYSSKLTSWSYRSTKGENTPDFFKRLKRGDLLPMTYFESFTTSGSSSGSFITKNGTNTYAWTPMWVFAEAYIHPDELLALQVEKFPVDPSVYVQAAAAKLQSRGFDALTFLAELKQTIRMFEGLVKRLITAVYRGKIVDSWLEWRYGWRTLFFDMKDFSETLHEVFTKAQSLRNKESVGDSFTYSSSRNYDISYTSSTIAMHESYTLDASFRGSIIADMIPPRFSFNPITTGWELVRFSFIIDWFLQVGQFLSAMSFLVSTNQYVASNGVKLNYTETQTVVGSTPKAGWSVLAASGSSTVTTELRTRWPTTVPMKIYANLHLDVSKVLDLMALLVKVKIGK